MPEGKLLEQAGLDAAHRQRRLEFLDFTPHDRDNLRAIHEFASAHADEIVEDFCAHLARFPELRALLGDAAQTARLKELQRAHLLRMTEAQLDTEYFERGLRVGDAHQRVELQPHWYLGTYHLYLRLIVDRLRTQYADPARVLDLLGSLSKVVFLDMGIAMDAYIMGGYVHRALAQEYQRMAEVAQRALGDREELEQVKTDLTNMIVHDLKGPLGGILTVTQIALRKRGAVPDPHARHFEQIQRSARDLLRMIENLLEIDQMDEGCLQLRLELVDVAQLLTECADEFCAAAEMTGQTLHITVGDDVPVLTTDRWLLRRVLNNLVLNAIRHSGATGRIDLAAEYSHRAVRLCVTDRGRGIALEEQRHLFLKHRRRSRHDHSRDDTGLGLVFCKMAVELCGGTIDVRSTPGAGTTFTVTLPVAIESQ